MGEGAGWGIVAHNTDASRFGCRACRGRRRSAARRRRTNRRAEALVIYKSIEDGLMDDTDQLRNRATRLFALAQKAREKGHPDYAKELTWLASETVGQAVTMERRRVAHSELAH